MASGGIKAAQVQSRSSVLNVFWAATTVQKPSIRLAVKHATAWLNRSRGIPPDLRDGMRLPLAAVRSITSGPRADKL